MKSGNLNLPEPSGPLQACNGTALPFFLFDAEVNAVLSGSSSTFYVMFLSNTEFNTSNQLKLLSVFYSLLLWTQ